MLTLPPLSLYIHLPWCIRKCPYCDFNSHAVKNEIPEQAYVDALINDLQNDLHHITDRKLQSIFFGGGTPSLFSAEAIQQILTAVKNHIPWEDTIEITLEANPGTVEKNRFAGFRAAGVNRLSLGIQSFHDEHLKILGRIHHAQEACHAIETTINVGFTNFNLDIMYGLPQQNIQQALNDLKQALQFNPTHLSWYQLNIEPNTLFAHQKPVLPDDETLWEMQLAGQTLLQQHQLQQYEISAYAKSSQQSQHNNNYWRFGDYLGIGAGAHSKITNLDSQTISRTWKHKNPKNYLDCAKNFIGEQKIISSNELPFEFMLNALRLHEPINFSLFETRTGLPINTIENSLNKAVSKELLIIQDNKIILTELGKRFYNNLLEIFLS